MKPYFLILFIGLAGLSSCSKSSTNSPSSSDQVKDYDGNIYNTVVIGTQTWMAENLETTHYRNGTPISNLIDSTQWVNDTTGAYCDYNNDTSNGGIYGHLYNWYAVNNPDSLCPAGWHVPSDSEWTVLINYLGGEAIAGGLMMSTGTSLWVASTAGATDISGFAGLPGGGRYYNGTFYYIGQSGIWWSSSADSTSGAWIRYLYGGYGGISRGNYNKGYGFSVRCVRD